MAERTYTALGLEAALCVWEHLTECKMSDALSEPFEEAWGNHGTVSMRLEVCPAIASVALMVFDSLPQDYICEELGWSYDWDFIPFIVGQVRAVRRGSDYKLMPVFPTVRAMVNILLHKEQ
jgi:hypothetical protein